MKRLLVYYGWPSLINGADTARAAADHFDRYDHVILGAGLEHPKHPNHDATRQILDLLSRPLVFGYVDLGVTTNDLDPAEISQRVHLWRQVGAGGIFYDDAGQDFGVSPERQAQAIGLAHNQDMLVCVNCWNPEDVNPWAAYVLAESWAVQDGRKVGWRRRGRQLARLDAYVLSVATGLFDRRLMRRAYRAAQRCGHEAFGWGEPGYSTDTVAPWRPRPGART